MKLLIVLTMLAAPLAVLADTEATNKLTASELQVIAHYHQGNVMEVELARIAMARGTPAIKSFAQMLLRDHAESDAKLKALVKQTGQSIPTEKGTEADQEQRAEVKQRVAALKKLKGTEFDREYLRMMVDVHEKDLANIDAQISAATNPKLAEALRKKKQTLQHHADAARELMKSNAAA